MGKKSEERIFFTSKHEVQTSYLDDFCYCQTDHDDEYWKDEKGECRYCRGLGFRPTTEEGEAIIDFIERYKHIIKKILGREEN